MFVSVLLCFIAALTAAAFSRRAGRSAGWWLSIVPAALFIYYLGMISRVASGEVVADRWSWVPSLGVEFSLYLDGLSLLFALLILSIGSVVVIYAGSYLGRDELRHRFYSFIFLFMGSMLGLVLASNLMTLFIFWELTSIGSFLLIGYKHEKGSARDAALQALLITGTGGLALLAAVILIGQVYGTYEFTELLLNPDLLRQSGLYLPTLLLVCLAAFTKSAQFPFHFWLPGAMAAPAPVSTYLHSATMVKAGVYLLARLNPVLGGTETWHYLLTLTGAVTMLVGVLMALPQRDLKRLLAYSTVSALGTLILLLGLDTDPAMKAASLFLLVHAFYKSSLFLVIGVVDHKVGIRDREKLGGLWRSMPIVGTASLLAALSMAGLPPMLGFIGKELLYEAKLGAPAAAPLVTAAGVSANVLMVVLAVVSGILPFLGRKKEAAFEGPIPLALQVGPSVFALAGLVIGLFPGLIDRLLISPAASAIRAEATVIDLYLWHGINPVLLLSVVTISLGALLSWQRRSLFTLGDRMGALELPGPAALYQFSLRALKGVAALQTSLLQNGRLRSYIFILTLSFGVLALFFLLQKGALPELSGDPVWLHEIAIAAVILVAVVASIRAHSRLTAVISVGVVGYGIALLFILFGAPDLAMTQFLIETLTVILFVYVLYRLPNLRRFSSRASRVRDGALAVGSGLLVALLVLIVLEAPHSSEVSTFYGEASWTQAFGRNVVNVILVDFRALDTLGEILVLSLAALGVVSLLVRKGGTR